MPERKTDFSFLLKRHLPDHIWRRFLAGGLQQSEAALLESHLLLCPVCQGQYAEAA